MVAAGKAQLPRGKRLAIAIRARLPNESVAGSLKLKSEQFRTVWPILFALMAAVSTGIMALSRIDFTGVDYRQHPIATIAGTLLPSVIAGVIAYFVAPRVFPNFRLKVNAARLGWKELLAVSALLVLAIGVGSIVTSPTRDKHKENPFAQVGPRIVGDSEAKAKPARSNNGKPNPFDAIDDKDDADNAAEARQRKQCVTKAVAAYIFELAQLNADPPPVPAPPPPPQVAQASPPLTPEQIKAAYQAIRENPDLSLEVKEIAIDELNQHFAIQQMIEQANDKAKKVANDNAAKGYMTRILNGAPAGIIRQIANDPLLDAQTKMDLADAATHHSLTARRAIIKAYCSVVTACLFGVSNDSVYTRGVADCVRSEEKDDPSD